MMRYVRGTDDLFGSHISYILTAARRVFFFITATTYALNSHRKIKKKRCEPVLQG